MSEKVAEKAVEKKAIVVDEKVVAMAKIFEKDVTVEKDGTVIIKDGVYFDCLPEGITKEFDEQHRAFRETFAAAASYVVADKALKAYVVNKDLEEVSATFPTSGRDKLIVQSRRTVSTVNPKDRTQTFINHGVLRTIPQTSYADKDTGMMGTVFKFAKEAAGAALRDL